MNIFGYFDAKWSDTLSEMKLIVQTTKKRESLREGISSLSFLSKIVEISRQN